MPNVPGFKINYECVFGAEGGSRSGEDAGGKMGLRDVVWWPNKYSGAVGVDTASSTRNGIGDGPPH